MNDENEFIQGLAKEYGESLTHGIGDNAVEAFRARLIAEGFTPEVRYYPRPNKNGSVEVTAKISIEGDEYVHEVCIVYELIPSDEIELAELVNYYSQLSR